MKDRIVLEETQVVPFLEGSYTLQQALADLDKKVRVAVVCDLKSTVIHVYD